jgi:hypothetical protein
MRGTIGRRILTFIKDFIRGFKSYPPTAYDIGQLAAENLIWTLFMATIGCVIYLIYKI